MFISSFLRQTAVRWTLTGQNGYGENTYSTAVQVSVRWQYTQKLFVNAQGKEEMSQSIVYLDTDLNNDDYLYLGVLSGLTVQQKANPLLVLQAFPVKSVEKYYDMSGVLSGLKGML
jgi:hypothetical protein